MSAISLQWALFITFILLLIQSGIYKRWGMRKIEYTRYFSTSTVFEGEEVQMVERISNEKLLPIPWLRVESRIDASLKFEQQSNLDIKHEEFHKSLFSLMPYMRIIRRHRIECTKRGCYRLNSAALTTGDTFGFLETSRSVGVSAQLLVYPRLVNLEDMPLPSHSWQGSIVIQRWIVEDPFMITGVREYQNGDPLNRVNWSATARAGRLQIHKREFTADPRLMIYLNIDTADDMWDAVTDVELIERGISYAASLAQFAIDMGIETGFGCNGHLVDEEGQPVRIPPQCSSEHLMELLKAMAMLVIKRSLTFYTFLEQDVDRGMNNTDILIVTPYRSERLDLQINRLRELGNAVEILMLEKKQEGGEGNGSREEMASRVG